MQHYSDITSARTMDNNGITGTAGYVTPGDYPTTGPTYAEINATIGNTSTTHVVTNIQPTLTLEQLNNEMKDVVLPVTVIIGLESVIGFVGNILILLVYSKRYKHCNFRYFVLCMAVIDLTSCVTTLPGEIISQLNWYDYEHGWICKTKSYFNVFTAWGSALTLLLLAFDRYRKICHPLGWQIQPSFALKLCLVGIVISAFVSIPITILWGKQKYVYQQPGGANITVSICEKSTAYADGIYPFVYVACTYIVPIGLMILTICVLNALIGRQLFCRMREIRREVVTNTGDSPSRVTRRPSANSSDTSGEATPSDASENDSIRTLQNGISRQRSIIKIKYIHSSSTKSKYKSGIDGDKCPQSGPCTVSGSMRDKSLEEITQVTEINVEETIAIKTKINIAKPPTEKPSTNKTNRGAGTPKILLKLARGKRNRTSESLSSLDSANSRVEGNKESEAFRRKRKTMIMLVLTSVFVVTMSLYVGLLSVVAGTEGILRSTTDSQKVVFFFFWRLYFVNCVINPILYGFMDPRFRNGLRCLFTSFMRFLMSWKRCRH